MSNYLYAAGPGTAQFVSVTRYWPLAGTDETSTEAQAQMRIRDSYTWSHLGVNIASNTVTATSTVRSRVNGADGNQAVSIPSSSTGFFEDTSHSDSLADGDLVAIALTTGGSGSSLLANTISSLLGHSGDVSVLAAASLTNGWQANGATRWTPVHGPLVASTSEVRTEVTCRQPTTLSRLRAYVAANAASGTSSIKLRVNEADGNQALSISAGATGEFEDTTHSDAIGDGDEVDLQLTGGGAGAISVSAVNCESSSGLMAVANLSGAIFTGTTLYRAIGTKNSSGAESVMQVSARTTAIAFGSLFFSTDSNSRSVSTTVALRRNGSSDLSLSVPASTTGFFEDTSATVIPAASSDTLNYAISSGAGSGTLTLRNISITQAPFAAATIAGATATATAAANSGVVKVARSIPGESATAAAAANTGTVAAVRIVSVSGGTATVTAAANAGVVQTFPAAIITGVTATATAAANAGTVSGVSAASVAGERATATAAANAGVAQIASVVSGAPAAANAAALLAAITALNLGHPHPVIPAPGIRLERKLAAPRVHGNRPGMIR